MMMSTWRQCNCWSSRMLDPLGVSVARMLHQSRYDRGIILTGMRGSVLTTLVPILFTQRSNSVDGFECAPMCLSGLSKPLKLQTRTSSKRRTPLAVLGSLVCKRQLLLFAFWHMVYLLMLLMSMFILVSQLLVSSAPFLSGYHFCIRGVLPTCSERRRCSRLLKIREECGFPGMLGSIDCMHGEWCNCPSAYKGMFTGRGKHPSMILETVASHDLWIWHAYFGMPGSCNDINVLQKLAVFSAYLKGKAAPVSFIINGHTYDMGYYLADGIYPNWPAFVKTISHPLDMKASHFAKEQEKARKDIERCFGVL